MEELANHEITSQENILRRHMKRHHPREAQFAEHRLWMSKQQREFPLPFVPYKIGVYIRYFNQTSHTDYLEYHKREFEETIALCPRWTLIDFYVDKGAKAPRMENSKEWVRLLTDALNGKVDLIITQNLSFISRDPGEMTLIARLLAAQQHPVGIYIVSEDIFTLASYFRSDLKEELPWIALPHDELDQRMIDIPRASKPINTNDNDEGSLDDVVDDKDDTDNMPVDNDNDILTEENPAEEPMGVEVVS